MSNKRISIFFFIGFFSIIVLLFIVRDVGEQNKVITHAAASTTLAFTNVKQNAEKTVSVDVLLTPGTNAVSLVNLTIDYDNTKLVPSQINGFVPNTSAFPAILDGPIYNTCTGTQCSMYIALSIGNTLINAITTKTNIATLNFQTISTGNTQLSFDTKTQIYSVAATDQANQNVLATANPTTITLGNTQGITATPIIETTITPRITTTPTTTPTPGTTINLQLALPGLGLNGGNLHPLHPLRTITFYLYDIDTNELLTKTNSVVFDGSYFIRPIIDLGEVPSGNYQIFIQSPQYLVTRLTQGGNKNSIQIKNGQVIQVSPNTLIAGDIAPQKGTTYGDNILDILDYNAILSCYDNKLISSQCSSATKQATDFDDNGVIDAIDYNILLRGFAITHIGDTIPGNSDL